VEEVMVLARIDGGVGQVAIRSRGVRKEEGEAGMLGIDRMEKFQKFDL